MLFATPVLTVSSSLATPHSDVRHKPRTWFVWALDLNEEKGHGWPTISPKKSDLGSVSSVAMKIAVAQRQTASIQRYFCRMEPQSCGEICPQVVLKPNSESWHRTDDAWGNGQVGIKVVEKPAGDLVSRSDAFRLSR